MSQNPYANYGNTSYESAPVARTSVLAIMSLVTALSCCLSFLGPILGGAALIRISSSGGRRKGAGIAIAGIIIGLVVTAIEGFIFYGMYSFANQAAAWMAPISERVVTDDPTPLRNSVSPTLRAQITNAEWTRFKKEVTDELGTLQPPAKSFGELISQYKDVMKMMENQNNNNQIPVPLAGDKAKGILLVHMPMRGARVKTPSSGSAGTPAAEVLSKAENLSVLLPSGKEVWLIPPDKLLPAGGTPPSAPKNLPPGSTPPGEQPNGV